jgi:hypothetical protein
MSKVTIFDPRGIKPEDYRHRYPELERTEEFERLTPKQLIFVWWYANATSDLVLYEPDDYVRVGAALAKSGYIPTKNEKEAILDLRFSPDLAVAIKKMSTFDPGARFAAFKMVKKIFDQYQKIVDQGTDSFKTKSTKGTGENTVVTEEVDTTKYVNTTTKIAEELPGLLAKLEEGFAVVTIAGDEVVAGEENSDLRDWHTKKES